MFKKPLCTIPPGSGGQPAPHVPLIARISTVPQHMRIRDTRRMAQKVQDTRSNPPHGGPMSIWSCARHNGMTGAGSDRDAGPTPVQRARFREECSRKRRRVRICWRRLECTRCTPGRQQRVRSKRAETGVSVPLALRCLHQLFPLRHGKMAWRSMSRPVRVRQKGDRAGTSGTGPGARIALQQTCSRCITLQRTKG